MPDAFVTSTALLRLLLLSAPQISACEWFRYAMIGLSHSRMMNSNAPVARKPVGTGGTSRFSVEPTWTSWPVAMNKAARPLAACAPLFAEPARNAPVWLSWRAQNSAFGQGNVAAVTAILGGKGATVESVLVAEDVTEFTPFAQQVLAGSRQAHTLAIVLG